MISAEQIATLKCTPCSLRARSGSAARAVDQKYQELVLNGERSANGAVVLDGAGSSVATVFVADNRSVTAFSSLAIVVGHGNVSAVRVGRSAVGG